MPARLVEIVAPPADREPLLHILDDFHVAQRWLSPAEEGLHVHVVLDAGKVERLLDSLVKRFGEKWPGRVVLVPVEATLPRLEEHVAPRGPRPSLRVSRDQLHQQVDESLRLNAVFFAMALLSAIVAGIGLLKDNVAIIIGAMVLAPLLAPNIGLALATTLGEWPLARKAILANVVGVTTAVAAAVVLGAWADPDPDHHEIASRTVVDFGDIALAVVAGVAGALSYTTAVSANLIGVMVAVAMMPPLVVAGMMAGAREWVAAYGALLLLAVNVISVNLAAVATFFVQGILPRQWWRQAATRRLAWRAMAFWSLLLILLAAAVALAPSPT